MQTEDREVLGTKVPGRIRGQEWPSRHLAAILLSGCKSFALLDWSATCGAFGWARPNVPVSDRTQPRRGCS